MGHGFNQPFTFNHPTIPASSILLVTNSTWNLFHYRRPWIEGLVSAGYVVLTAAPVDTYLGRLEQLTSTTHFPLRAMDPKGQNGWSELACIREIRTVYRQVRPTLVVHFTVKPNTYGGLVARWLGLPYVAIITGLGYPFLHPGWRNRIVPLLYKIGLKRAKNVVFYNQTDARLFLDNQLVSRAQLALINGSGVDSNYFSQQPLPPIEHGILRLIYVGRILRDKGILELLKASRRVLNAGIKVQLTILGDLGALNPEVMEREKFLDFIEAINAECSTVFPTSPPIQYLEAVDDVRSHLAAHHVFVLPSYREGLSRAGVEALCVGRPVLTTDVPGCRELIRSESTNGVLVPAQNVLALETAIRAYAGLAFEDLVQMGQHSRQHAEEQFSAQVTTAAFLELIQPALEVKSS